MSVDGFLVLVRRLLLVADIAALAREPVEGVRVAGVEKREGK